MWIITFEHWSWFMNNLYFMIPFCLNVHDTCAESCFASCLWLPFLFSFSNVYGSVLPFFSLYFLNKMIKCPEFQKGALYTECNFDLSSLHISSCTTEWVSEWVSVGDSQQYFFSLLDFQKMHHSIFLFHKFQWKAIQTHCKSDCWKS